MRRKTLNRQSNPPVPATEAGAEVTGLLRRLVQQVVASGAPAAATGDHGETVILDLQVDGVRCQLVRTSPRPEHRQAMLSPREREIARMVAKGYANKTIAAVLDISTWTVDAHLRRMFTKLRLGSRAAMVARLMEIGMLEQ
jgi:DNA-binding CsgD family transcriptional regulator